MSEKQANEQPLDGPVQKSGQDFASTTPPKQDSPGAIEHPKRKAPEKSAKERELVVLTGKPEPASDARPQPNPRGQKVIPAQARRQAPAIQAKARPPVVTPKPPPPLATTLEASPTILHPSDFFAKLRRTRRRRFFQRLALFVGLPTLLVTLYVFFWATPRYVSEFEITYQAYQNTQTLSSGLVQSLLGSGQASSDFGSILYEYIRSATLLGKLDKKLNLRKYYSSDRIDYPVRLSSDASAEQFLNYYRQHIVDVSEGLGGYLTIDVQAFDPQFAYALAQAIVQACDEMVDQMTLRARQDEVKFAEEELTRQEDRVRQARLAETKFQNEHGDINPSNTASQIGQIIGTLEGQLAQARATLATLGYASPNAPQVRELKNQIAALDGQLQIERNRLAGTNSGAYSQILQEYSRLQLEEQFAQNAYQAAQQGLAVARADAARKQSYLVDFVAPSQPDWPSQFFYISYIASAFLGSLFLYAIGSLIAGAFRDQAGL